MTDVATRLARFGRALRAHGVPVTLRDELDAAEALAIVGLEDRRQAQAALRIALKVPRPDYETFDRLLGVFWHGESAAVVRAPRPPRDVPAPGRLLRWDPNGQVTVVREQTGEGNGCTLDRQGRLLMCEGADHRRITRMDAAGTVTAVAERW